MHPVADWEEPVTAPVVLATSAVGSVTLDRPDPGMTTVIEAVEPEELVTAPMGSVDSDGGAAPKRVTRTHHAGWVTFFTWMRNVGAIIVLFVVWQLWGTAISQHQAQSQLKAQFDALVRAHHPPKATASGPTLIPASVKIPSPPDGSVVAELQIPAIGLDQYVVAGTSAAQLSQGPGHYDGTAMPGQAGNVAIAGHRTTHGAPFNRLGQLVHGDRIILTTLSGQHLTYVVSGTPQAVSPNDVAVLNYLGDNRITLTTCTPEFSAAQRLIVVGDLKLPGAAPQAPPAKHISYHVANSATASWDWSLLPAVGVEVCLLLLLGLSYRRFDVWFGRSGKWFILVPLWVAGLYLLFASLTTFLPETL
jgi:sortase A